MKKTKSIAIFMFIFTLMTGTTAFAKMQEKEDLYKAFNMEESFSEDLIIQKLYGDHAVNGKLDLSIPDGAKAFYRFKTETANVTKICVYDDKIKILSYPSPDIASSEYYNDLGTHTFSIGFAYPLSINMDSWLSQDIFDAFYTELVKSGDLYFDIEITDKNGKTYSSGGTMSIKLPGNLPEHTYGYTLTKFEINGHNLMKYLTSSFSDENFHTYFAETGDYKVNGYAIFVDLMTWAHSVKDKEPAIERAFDYCKISDDMFDEKGVLRGNGSSSGLNEIVEDLETEYMTEYVKDENGFYKYDEDGEIMTKYVGKPDFDTEIETDEDGEYFTEPQTEAEPETVIIKEKTKSRSWITAAIPIFIGAVILIVIYILTKKNLTGKI